MTDYFDLGTYKRRVTTSSPEAQLWFDRGLMWCYGFNHEESVRCFKRATEFDGDCAMAYWGMAYADGPNYNKPWEFFDEVDMSRSCRDAYVATEKALFLANSADSTERALIEALHYRYPNEAATDDFNVRNDDYAAAMRKVYQLFSDDLDVCALFSEALINLTPWALWDLDNGKPAEGANTLEAMEVLNGAITQMEKTGPERHPGVLHMYIHLMEMSPYPEHALRAADQLRGLVPDAGHLQHMPTHIDVLCGYYDRVVESNTSAIIADRKYLEREGALNFYSLYRCHDYHFKIYGAMFLGQYKPALDTANEMIATLPEELLQVESPPMADWAEGFVSLKMHVQIRFGKWQEIIDEPLPQNEQLFCVTTAMMHYAKGIAYASTRDVDAAKYQQSMFKAILSQLPESRYIFNNKCTDILAIADEMLSGEIEYRKENFDCAFMHLRKAVELDDNLPYDEPWGWMQPTRHALGALLLEQGNAEEAEAVYRADLGLDNVLSRACQHPDNVWSLQGFHECLRRLGKTGEAAMVKPRLDLARSRTDVPIKTSCYCRLD